MFGSLVSVGLSSAPGEEERRGRATDSTQTGRRTTETARETSARSGESRLRPRPERDEASLPSRRIDDERKTNDDRWNERNVKSSSNERRISSRHRSRRDRGRRVEHRRRREPNTNTRKKSSSTTPTTFYPTPRKRPRNARESPARNEKGNRRSKSTSPSRLR